MNETLIKVTPDNAKADEIIIEGAPVAVLKRVYVLKDV